MNNLYLPQQAQYQQFTNQQSQIAQSSYLDQTPTESESASPASSSANHSNSNSATTSPNTSSKQASLTKQQRQQQLTVGMANESQQRRDKEAIMKYVTLPTFYCIILY